MHLVTVSTDPRGLERASLVHPLLDEDAIELLCFLDNVAVEVESVDCAGLLLTHGVSLVELDCVVGELTDNLPPRLVHTSHSSLSSRFADRTCLMKLQAI